MIATLSSCIKNDIPYPRIQANFLTISAEEQSKAASIDSLTRNVTLFFDEQTDIQNVKIESYTITEGATLSGIDFNSPIDLSSPLKVKLSLYQDWSWTITGQQHIERYFTVEGQVGASVIDVPGQRVIAYVSKNTDISKVKIENIKLGPEGSTMQPDITDTHVDFSKPVKVDVTAYGRTSDWTIFVERTNASATTVRADAWTNVAWIYGTGEANKENGIEYRKKGDTEWTRATANELTIDGGSFHARLIHLPAETSYETRAYSGEAYGATLEFTTGKIEQVPNHDLNNWWLEKKVWNPWAEGTEQYWDTGNKGATTIGESNSVPTDDTPSGTGLAAKLETRFIGIGTIGKLAAGNLFVGKYVRTDGTNGVLHFGRPFTQRPTKVRCTLKCSPKTIDYSNNEMQHCIGQPDTCTVWAALIDQAEPFEIRTNPKNRQLFNPNGSYVVAHGSLLFSKEVPEYTTFEFELNYKSTDRVPTYIIIAASASKLGDYFTGGTGSILYIDDIELLYDY